MVDSTDDAGVLAHDRFLILLSQNDQADAHARRFLA